MTDKEVPSDNIIEFIRDNSNEYFLLGVLTDAYDSLNEIAKREFLESLKDKVKLCSPKQADALLSLINAMKGK